MCNTARYLKYGILILLLFHISLIPGCDSEMSFGYPLEYTSAPVRSDGVSLSRMEDINWLFIVINLLFIFILGTLFWKYKDRFKIASILVFSYALLYFIFNLLDFIFGDELNFGTGIKWILLPIAYISLGIYLLTHIAGYWIYYPFMYFIEDPEFSITIRLGYTLILVLLAAIGIFFDRRLEKRKKKVS